MPQNSDVRPFVKWVGGKGKSVPKLKAFIPKDIEVYVEPCVGGGAMYFGLQFQQAIINDSNSELINAYVQIRDNLEGMLSYLKDMHYDKEQFLEIRAWDRSKDFYDRDPAQRAARFIYLNKTCYNGLYRVSKRNYFNTPFGRYTNPVIIDLKNLQAVRDYLKERPTEILNDDYWELLDRIPRHAFVYIDPPYHPISETSFFTSYVPGAWGTEDQQRLAQFCEELDRRGIRFMESNSTAPLIRTLYAGFRISTITAARLVNSKVEGRNEVEELVITNYQF
ncbi:MAG: DNA adenine methylase [Succinivibrio sp.]|nr:DNA adenine methylase [Succinivibrio sp.]